MKKINSILLKLVVLLLSQPSFANIVSLGLGDKEINGSGGTVKVVYEPIASASYPGAWKAASYIQISVESQSFPGETFNGGLEAIITETYQSYNGHGYDDVNYTLTRKLECSTSTYFCLVALGPREHLKLGHADFKNLYHTLKIRRTSDGSLLKFKGGETETHLILPDQ